MTTRLGAALAFVLGQETIDRVVIGVQGSSELEQVAANAMQRPDLKGAETVASADPILVNPAVW